MSQTSLLPPGTTASPPQNRPPSVMSGKHGISKSLKQAFSRRKKSSGNTGSLRRTDSDLDFDLASQRSGSIGPESVRGSEQGDRSRLSEEAMVDSSPELRYVTCKSPHICPAQPPLPPSPPKGLRASSIPHPLSTTSDLAYTFDVFSVPFICHALTLVSANSALSGADRHLAECPPDPRLHRHRCDALVRSPALTSDQ